MPGGPTFFAYSTNYLIDVKAGVIVDVEATPAYRTDEVNSTKMMADRVEHRFDALLLAGLESVDRRRKDVDPNLDLDRHTAPVISRR